MNTSDRFNDPVPDYVRELRRVKEMLMEPNAKFADVQNAFLDLVMEHRELVSEGRRIHQLPKAENFVLELAFKSAGMNLKKLKRLKLMEIPGCGVIHGIGYYKAPVCVSVLFFTDICLGLMSIGDLQTGQFQFARMSVMHPVDEGMPGRN